MSQHSKVFAAVKNRVPHLNMVTSTVMGSSAEFLKRVGFTTRKRVRDAVLLALVRTTDADDDQWQFEQGWETMLQLVPPSYLQLVRSRCVSALASLGVAPADIQREAEAAAPEPDSEHDMEPLPEPDIEPGSASHAMAPPPPPPASAPPVGVEVRGASSEPGPSSPAASDVVMEGSPLVTELQVSFQIPLAGVFPWNNTGDKICAHIYRDVGEQIPCWMQGSNPYAMGDLIRKGYPYFFTQAELTFLAFQRNLWKWLSVRPALRSRLVPTLVEPPAELVRSFGCPGRFFGFALAQCAAVPVDQQPTTGFHATSLYTLASSMQNGLQSGFNHLTVNRKDKQGIYNHLLKRVHLCNNYLLHTFLDDSGWAVGPLIQLEYPWLDPGGRGSCLVRRRSEKDHQCITWPDVAQVSHIWFHAVHSSMYAAMPKAEGFHSEGWFQPQFEIDPDKLFEHTLEQSRAACHGTKQHLRFQSRCSLQSGLLCLAGWFSHSAAECVRLVG